jgi:pyrroloquinoline-quinone synthase
MMFASQDFFNQIDQRIARYDLLQHPYYRAWSAGELTKDDLREYAAEYWAHVSAFPTYLSALHATLEDAELRRTVLRNLADEEGIDAPGGRPHSDLWMDFARGMGADEREVRARQLQPETQALLAKFRALMTPDTGAALAALYAYESQVPRIATEKAAGLRAHYGADEATCRYFTLHRTADVHHAAVWKDALRGHLALTPEKAGQALDASETAAHALWTALDGMERERLARTAN